MFYHHKNLIAEGRGGAEDFSSLPFLPPLVLVGFFFFGRWGVGGIGYWCSFVVLLHSGTMVRIPSLVEDGGTGLNLWYVVLVPTIGSPLATRQCMGVLLLCLNFFL